MELPKIIFLIILALILVLLTWISALLYKRQSSNMQTEREREILARSSSYQVAFLLLVVYCFANWVFSLATGMQWGDIYTVCLTGFLLGIFVFAVAAVKRKAYDFINEMRKYNAVFVILIFIGALYSGIAAMNLAVNPNYLLIYEGTVTYLAFSLELGVTLILLAVVLKIIVGPKEKEVLTEEEQKQLEEQFGSFFKFRRAENPESRSPENSDSHSPEKPEKGVQFGETDGKSSS